MLNKLKNKVYDLMKALRVKGAHHDKLAIQSYPLWRTARFTSHFLAVGLKRK